MLFSVAEAAWIVNAHAPALLEGDAAATWWGVLGPGVGYPAAVAMILWRVEARWAVLKGLSGGVLWAAPATAALVALPDADFGVWLAIPLLLLLGLLFGRVRSLGALSMLAAFASTAHDVEVRELLEPAGGSGDELVVLLTLDTFRADHVGAIGGYRRDISTPRLDALAEQGLLFTAGEAEVPLTLPSHTTMLTGRSSWEAGVLRNGQVMAEGVETVATELRAAGWRTGAFLGSHVLHAGTGLGRGFEHYDDLMGPATWQATIPGALMKIGWLAKQPFQRSGEVVIERALRWRALADGPTFLWVHLYDAHSPYEPPPPYDSMYDADADDAPGNPDELAVWRAEQPPAALLFRLQPRDVRKPVARYAGEISWTDELVGRLVDGLPADTPIVVAADHGESLSEHGYLLNHGASVKEPSLHVPILVRGPGVAPEVVEAPTSVRRVGPTVLRLAGLAPDEPTLFDAPSRELVAYAPGQQARPDLDLRKGWKIAWRKGYEKWVVSTRDDTERFDLLVDPDELVNLAEGTDSEEVTERGRVLLEQLQSDEVGVLVDESAEMEEALRALGYVN